MELHLITGRVEGDIRTGKSANNKPFAAFTLVTSRTFRDQTFKSFPNFMAWGDSIKICERLQPGDLVQVLASEARAEAYVATKGQNAGKPVGKVTYTVREIEIVNTGGAPAPQEDRPAQQPKPATPPTAKPDNDDNDVPF